MNYNHPDFVSAYKSGLIKVLIDSSLAVRIANSPLLPANYRAAHIFWSWVAVLFIPFSLYLTVFKIWWLGLLLLFFAPSAIWRAMKTTAQQWVLEFSLEDATFYSKALTLGAIIIKPAD